QLFDVRGHRQYKKWLQMVPEDRMFMVFKEETLEELDISSYKQDVHIIDNEEKAKQISVSGKNIVLVDLPPSVEWLEMVIKGETPDRIYAFFYQKNTHFFSTMPTREHFKWYYAFLMKRKVFDLNKYGDELAKHRGWSRETIDFMSKVFFELKFVTMKNGFIQLNPTPGKRELNESPAYQNKLVQYELENKLLYSSYEELKNWFERRIGSPVNNEEEVEIWI
ncbi:MAG TPA: single-stranded-DNA-specific exonuclease C-terminal domain-containing protein, partial [Chondromyces sp.]|nr:single-stranded-DNA-specific exonuclease C-terminal domain-containing protein [Chondromyces sp.]